MKTQYILLWLEGPLQSWGVDSKFGRRETLPFPTKSGILGMLCAALGASGEQHELLADMAQLRQTVISFVRVKQDIHKEDVKADPELFLRDFQMVGSGYDDSDPWQSLLIPKRSDGGKSVGGGTKLTHRYYLQDAKFAVIVEVPHAKANEFSDAFKMPVYDISLGRKNCVPTEFVFQGCFETEEGAFDQALKIATNKNVIENFRVLDGGHDGETFTLNDVPIQFGDNKKYRDRQVTLVLADG